ncbi:MAG: chemotaxis protein CheW [Pseudomonadota bacterium]
MTTMDNKPDAAVELMDCWNRIGVAGDQSCEKLTVHVHCRNCEVYAGAAQRNLQRPVNEGYREEWAAHFRQARQERSRDDSAALAFRIGREWLALPATIIDSVAPEGPGHRLPHRSGAGLLGVVNVGGKLLPSISLATLLGIDDAGSATASGRHTFARLVVMQWEGQAFALPVADLHGIVRYASGALAAPAATINKGLVRYLTGVLSEADMHIGVLDAPLVAHQMTRLLR